MPGPIRILQIVTQMNRAGMESRLMDIYRHLDKSKFQFDFYTCRKEPGVFDEEIIRSGGRIFYNKPLNIRDIFSISDRFKDFFMENQEYKIVHSHLNQWSGEVLKGAKRAGVSIRIAHSRTALLTINKKNIIKNIIKRSVNVYATHRLAVSKEAGEWLFGKKKMDEGKVMIWPNAIDLDKFKFDLKMREIYRTKLSLNNFRVLVHVGNIRPEKNHKFLIRIFHEILKEDKNTKLMIIGKDYMNGQIQDLAQELNVADKILFLGSRTDVNYLLSASDVFVFPSLYEGFPGAVLEAQASGLPSVISKTITDEVVILKNVMKLDIEIKPEKWAEVIINTGVSERKETTNFLSEKGYGIYEVAKKMEAFYLETLIEKGG